jgi:hypothetical protein
MLEQMLKEFLIKLIREDRDVQSAINVWATDAYLNSVTSSVKHTLENDESVQDVIRVAIGEAIDNLTFDINVSR